MLLHKYSTKRPLLSFGCTNLNHLRKKSIPAGIEVIVVEDGRAVLLSSFFASSTTKYVEKKYIIKDTYINYIAY